MDRINYCCSLSLLLIVQVTSEHQLSVIPEQLTDCDESKEALIQPIVKLAKAMFHTDDTLKHTVSANCPNSKLLYKLPITFETLEFTCDSSFPTIWKFQRPPHQDIRIKDFKINKRRTVGSFDDTSSYRFQSNLTINFKDPQNVPVIFCAKLGKQNETNPMSRVDTYAGPTVLDIQVLITNGLEGQMSKMIPESRFGVNGNCNLTMKIDTVSQRFHCGGDSLPQIVKCGNPDECNSIFYVDDRDCGNKTFSNDNCSDECLHLSPSYSPAVIICKIRGSGDEHSIARRYHVHRMLSLDGQETRVMRLGRDSDHLETTLHVSKNETKAYFNQTVKFTCTGGGAYYTYGFTWGFENETANFTLKATSTEMFNTTIHSYQVETDLKFDGVCSGNVTIWCFGPRWNRAEWVNRSLTFALNVPKTPKITLNHQNEKDDTYEFYCNAQGEPTPRIRWLRGTRELEQSAERLMNYTVNESTHLIESVLIFKRKKRSGPSEDIILTCEAWNFMGNVSQDFTWRGHSSSHLWYWIGTSSAVVIVTVLFLGTILFVRRHYRKKLQLLSDEEISEFENGNSNADSHALILPYSMDNEIPQQDVTILESVILGTGQFGVVYKGRYKHNLVAIKTIVKTADVKYFKALLAEIKVMCYVGEHPNLVNMVGACTSNIRKREIYLLTEFCENGNLLKHLRYSRDSFLDLYQPKNKASKETENMELKLIDFNFNYHTKKISILPRISTLSLLKWSHEIACGMEYLSGKKVVHGDLAARNILLAGSMVAKIGDFGLSKQLLSDYGIYVQRMECPLPLKWLAIECLQDYEFSIQSDIWAYGITLFEIFSLGSVPYPGFAHWNFQSYTLLKEGYRMDKPQYSNVDVYNLMKACWNELPKSRPSFQKIREFFCHLILEMDAVHRLSSGANNYPSPTAENCINNFSR